MRRLVLVALSIALAWTPSAGAWTWPADGQVLQEFSFGGDPYAGGKHRGVDVADPSGADIVAPSAGTVTFAGSVPGGGKTVSIRTADGYSVTLVHLGTIGVLKGAFVDEGASVGGVGPSGTPEFDQPYVHLGVRVASDPQGYVDPLGFLPARRAPVAVPAPPPLVTDPVPSLPAEPAQTTTAAETSTPASTGTTEQTAQPADHAPAAPAEPAAETAPAVGQVAPGETTSAAPAEPPTADGQAASPVDAPATAGSGTVGGSSAAEAAPAVEATPSVAPVSTAPGGGTQPTVPAVVKSTATPVPSPDARDAGAAVDGAGVSTQTTPLPPAAPNGTTRAAVPTPPATTTTTVPAVPAEPTASAQPTRPTPVGAGTTATTPAAPVGGYDEDPTANLPPGELESAPVAEPAAVPVEAVPSASAPEQPTVPDEPRAADVAEPAATDSPFGEPEVGAVELALHGRWIAPTAAAEVRAVTAAAYLRAATEPARASRLGVEGTGGMRGSGLRGPAHGLTGRSGTVDRAQTARSRATKASLRPRSFAEASPLGSPRPAGASGLPRHGPLLALLVLAGLLVVSYRRRGHGGAAPEVLPEPLPIIDGSALLRDDPDLLRERRAASRARVHDDRGGHPHASPQAARCRDVLPDRRRRARVEGLSRRRAAGHRPDGVRRSHRRRLERAA
jgi:hypothetical protein